MLDPLSEVVTRLRPRAVFAKAISGAGAWAVRYPPFGHPSFCTVLQGSCRLLLDGQAPAVLHAGDFVLLPSTPGFTMSGFEPAPVRLLDPGTTEAVTGDVRHGTAEGEPDVRLLGGFFMFDGADADLLVSQLPPVVHLSGADRLATLVRLVREEAVADCPGRDLVLTRLVEVLLVEGLRAAPRGDAPAGLLRGLAEPRLAAALRKMHGEPARQWTVGELAREAALSRSVFFDRFSRIVGASPMQYLLGWRMTLAKDLLRGPRLPLVEVAERVGYSSASTFSTAFARHVGQPPGRFAASAAG
jgi:AraC-like DNA-binding protein